MGKAISKNLPLVIKIQTCRFHPSELLNVAVFLAKGCTFRWLRGNLFYTGNLSAKNKIKYISIIR